MPRADCGKNVDSNNSALAKFSEFHIIPPVFAAADLNQCNHFGLPTAPPGAAVALCGLHPG